MKKLAVISDNADLCSFLRGQFRDKKLLDIWDVNYFYTSYNKFPESMKEFGASEINIKDEKTVSKLIDECDIIFSLHCKQIFPKRLVEAVNCFNFHPGFNPFNRGWYPQVFSIINGLPIGATIHKMDSEVDHGEIVAQRAVEIHMDDTSLEVYENVIGMEKILISENLKAILDGTARTSTPRVEGNYNSILDFNNICNLDLDKVDTLENFINLLRALTHGDYKNAFFTKDGENYSVSIDINKV